VEMGGIEGQVARYNTTLRLYSAKHFLPELTRARIEKARTSFRLFNSARTECRFRAPSPQTKTAHNSEHVFVFVEEAIGR